MSKRSTCSQLSYSNHIIRKNIPALSPTFGPRAISEMSYKMDDYQVLETLNDSKFGLRQRISRSDGRLFERRQISYKFMDDALKEVFFSKQIY